MGIPISFKLLEIIPCELHIFSLTHIPGGLNADTLSIKRHARFKTNMLYIFLTVGSSIKVLKSRRSRFLLVKELNNKLDKKQT